MIPPGRDASLAPAQDFRKGGENVMAVTMQQKRVAILGVGVLIGLVLMNVAWAEIAAGLCQCFK